MNVVCILGEVENRLALEMGLAMLGHASVICSNLNEGMAALTSSTDLVVADSEWEGTGASGIAFLVSSILGNDRPRLILVDRTEQSFTGDEHDPERVFGVVRTPLTASKLHRMLRFADYANRRCPGLLARGVCDRKDDNSVAKIGPVWCSTQKYGQCSQYRTRCGIHVQQWFSSQCDCDWREYKGGVAADQGAAPTIPETGFRPSAVHAGVGRNERPRDNGGMLK